MYTLGMPGITRFALFWNPQGERKRGRPRNSWGRELEADVRSSDLTWGQLETVAQDRHAWRALVRAIGVSK